MRFPGLRAGVVLLLVFVMGVLAGTTFERLHSTHTPGLSGAALHAVAMESLEDSLSLDEGQMDQIHAIFAKHQHAIQSSWEQLRPSVNIAIEKVHREIGELLRPEQREAFHRWLGLHGADQHFEHRRDDQRKGHEDREDQGEARRPSPIDPE